MSSSVVVGSPEWVPSQVGQGFWAVVSCRRKASSVVSRCPSAPKNSGGLPLPQKAVRSGQPNKKPPSRYQRPRGLVLETKRECSAEVRAPTGETQPTQPSKQMSASNRQGLTPVAALCLRVVKGWLGVVRRGKGGELRNGVPYTRLKASEVREQLEAEQGVEVSTKTIQRALTELVVGGHLTRRQLYKHRYNRTYWYAPSEAEQQAQHHRPSVVASQQRAAVAQPASPPPTQKGAPERSPVSLQALSAQLPFSTQKAEGKPTAQQPETEGAPCGQPEPQQEAISKAWGKRKPTAPTPRTEAHSRRLQRAQQALAGVVERATAYRGFGSTEQSSVSNSITAPRYKAESPQAAGFLR